MKKQKPIYHGIFFDKGDIASYKEHLGIDTPSLPDVVENPHVTFGFRVEPVDGFDELFASYTDSDGLVLIVGYGNDGGNEGFLVKIDREIAEFYQGQIYERDGNGDTMHISRYRMTVHPDASPSIRVPSSSICSTGIRSQLSVISGISTGRESTTIRTNRRNICS